MVVRVELRDRSFNILEVLDKEFMSLSWGYSRNGGCDSFSFDLPREYCNERYISGDFNVRIYARNDTTQAYDLKYQGVVESKLPNVRGSEETISVQGHGYQAQLSRIYLDGVTFVSQEVSVIVKNILDNYVVPNTDITYDAGDITATSFTPSTITFNTDAQSALQTLADTTGTREWGVDKDRNFYFKQRSSTVGLRFPLGGKVTGFSSDDSFKDIVNRVIVQGGDVAGVPYTATFNDTLSQLKYGRRDEVVQNSSITTSDVAQQLATSVLTDKSDVVRRARMELVNHETFIESTIPIPLLAIVARGVLYGEKYYGTFLYSGEVSYQVNRVTYRISDDGVLQANIEMGKLRPDLSEAIGQVEYELEQLRSATL